MAGGAGAGIGGNGGKGGDANSEISQNLVASGHDGEPGESCGIVNINETTVEAYGGGGGSSINGTNAYGGTGGSGYPGAGIGGGGSGGGAGDHAAGGGGYCGGAGQPELANAFNGKTAAITPTYGTGGAYFENGNCSSKSYMSNPETHAYIGGEGSKCGDPYITQGGDGNMGGKGGLITTSNVANIYAYNGNKYTDYSETVFNTDGTTTTISNPDHAYNNGANQLEIFCQAGILRKVYKYDFYWNEREYHTAEYFKGIMGTQVKQEIDSYIAYNSVAPNHTNYLIRDSTSKSTSGYINKKTNSIYGVGSGAGYIEVSNGKFQ